jgi:hypothetical protein
MMMKLMMSPGLSFKHSRGASVEAASAGAIEMHRQEQQQKQQHS